MRLIDADALKECIKKRLLNGMIIGWLFSIIDTVPTIEAEPVKHGRWDDSGRYRFEDGSLAIRCTECGAALHSDEWEKYDWHYCPICGAKMDGDAK